MASFQVLNYLIGALAVCLRSLSCLRLNLDASVKSFTAFNTTAIEATISDVFKQVIKEHCIRNICH